MSAGMSMSSSLTALTRQCGQRLDHWPPSWENPVPTGICGKLVETFWSLLGPELSHEQVGLESQLLLTSR